MSNVYRNSMIHEESKKIIFDKKKIISLNVLNNQMINSKKPKYDNRFEVSSEKPKLNNIQNRNESHNIDNTKYNVDKREFSHFLNESNNQNYKNNHMNQQKIDSALTRQMSTNIFVPIARMGIIEDKTKNYKRDFVSVNMNMNMNINLNLNNNTKDLNETDLRINSMREISINNHSSKIPTTYTNRNDIKINQRDYDSFNKFPADILHEQENEQQKNIFYSKNDNLISLRNTNNKSLFNKSLKNKIEKSSFVNSNLQINPKENLYNKKNPTVLKSSFIVGAMYNEMNNASGNKINKHVLVGKTENSDLLKKDEIFIGENYKVNDNPNAVIMKFKNYSIDQKYGMNKIEKNFNYDTNITTNNNKISFFENLKIHKQDDSTKIISELSQKKNDKSCKSNSERSEGYNNLNVNSFPYKNNPKRAYSHNFNEMSDDKNMVMFNLTKKQNNMIKNNFPSTLVFKKYGTKSSSEKRTKNNSVAGNFKNNSISSLQKNNILKKLSFLENQIQEKKNSLMGKNDSRKKSNYSFNDKIYNSHDNNYNNKIKMDDLYRTLNILKLEPYEGISNNINRDPNFVNSYENELFSKLISGEKCTNNYVAPNCKRDLIKELQNLSNENTFLTGKNDFEINSKLIVTNKNSENEKQTTIRNNNILIMKEENQNYISVKSPIDFSNIQKTTISYDKNENFRNKFHSSNNELKYYDVTDKNFKEKNQEKMNNVLTKTNDKKVRSKNKSVADSNLNWNNLIYLNKGKNLNISNKYSNISKENLIKNSIKIKLENFDLQKMKKTKKNIISTKKPEFVEKKNEVGITDNNYNNNNNKLFKNVSINNYITDKNKKNILDKNTKIFKEINKIYQQGQSMLEKDVKQNMSKNYSTFDCKNSNIFKKSMEMNRINADIIQDKNKTLKNNLIFKSNNIQEKFQKIPINEHMDEKIQIKIEEPKTNHLANENEKNIKKTDEMFGLSIKNAILNENIKIFDNETDFKKNQIFTEEQYTSNSNLLQKEEKKNFNLDSRSTIKMSNFNSDILSDKINMNIISSSNLSNIASKPENYSENLNYEMDDIEDMNTIIKKLNFDAKFNKDEDIFALNNPLYITFDSKFKNEIDSYLFQNRNNNVEINKKDDSNSKSVSTQDTSSKKDISPNNFKKNLNKENFNNYRDKINLYNVHLKKI